MEGAGGYPAFNHNYWPQPLIRCSLFDRFTLGEALSLPAFFFRSCLCFILRNVLTKDLLTRSTLLFNPAPRDYVWRSSR